MSKRDSFSSRARAALERLSAAEKTVVHFFEENREEVLVSSAAALAAKIGTSDATVIRATQALGYAGLDDLRRSLADELRVSLSPAARLARTLGAVEGDVPSALRLMVDIHIQSLEGICRDIGPSQFEAAIDFMSEAPRIFIFGIGPSGALADYFAMQLGRFGIESTSLTQTGLLLADGLHRLRKDDLVLAFAYSRVYPEIEALLDQADRLGLPTILITDSLADSLGARVDLVLPVARGKADWFSTHTATFGLVEALLVGLAAKRSPETIASLKSLNGLRTVLAGEKMDLPVSKGLRAKRSI